MSDRQNTSPGPQPLTPDPTCPSSDPHPLLPGRPPSPWRGRALLPDTASSCLEAGVAIATVRLTLPPLIVGGKGEAAPEGRGKASSPRDVAAQPGPGRPCQPGLPGPGPSSAAHSPVPKGQWPPGPGENPGAAEALPAGRPLPAPTSWLWCPLAQPSEPAGWALRRELAGTVTPTWALDHLPPEAPASYPGPAGPLAPPELPAP